jgi:hypothetical protein
MITLNPTVGVVIFVVYLARTYRLFLREGELHAR